MGAHPIPVIDIFAGPGGLSEGFARLGEHDWESVLSSPLSPSTAKPHTSPLPRFRIALSIEKDAHAHQTLELRAFVRSFTGGPPDEYSAFLAGTLSRAALFDTFPGNAHAARREAWHTALGPKDDHDQAGEPPAEVDRRIRVALGHITNKPWILIGGPPCQAYSLAGRSRNRGKADYVPEDDHRHYLYKEYLRILSVHGPAVFVMENVKGILSARVDDDLIFHRILDDLRSPPRFGNATRVQYNLFSLSPRSQLSLHQPEDPRDYILKAESHGIPQARHRVILIGIRADLAFTPPPLPCRKPVLVRDVISSLPPLRSGLTELPDTLDTWRSLILESLDRRWFSSLAKRDKGPQLQAAIRKAVGDAANTELVRIHPVSPVRASSRYAPDWFGNDKTLPICNHETRAHISSDIHRYLFVSAWGTVHGRSPTLRDFPRDLLPDHLNAERAREGHGGFADRFRVQIADKPATTITSHISKDGHYYIHPDPSQCRSLTVREAARIQTFPDNYFFCGPRTEQYHQVGNAVPPLLAVQIARRVAEILAPHT